MKLPFTNGEKPLESRGKFGFLPSSWRYDWLFGLFLVVVTLIAYGPALQAGFIWDDDAFVTNNAVIKRADGLYRLWFTASTPDYYPMTFSLFWLEWRIWAESPLGYHVVNVLLHALSAVLLWRVLQRLNIPGAALAAAIFALHPVNVESAAWISEGKNTLCMLFYLGALLCWLKFEDSGIRRWYELALATFTLALFSKTAVSPLPLVLLGVTWWRRGRVGWKDVRLVVPFFVISAVLCSVTVWFHDHRAIGHTVIRTDDFWSRLAGAGWAVWFYLYKAVLPLNLVFVYPRWQIDARNVLSYVPLALLAAAFLLCWFYRRSWGKALFFGLAYFVVMLLPILGFLNIYFMRYSLVADHWEYFAIIGLIVLVAAGIKLGLDRVPWGKPFLQPSLCAALLLTLGVLTWRQCEMYFDPETLWQTTLEQNPNCWLAHNNLGNIFLEEGELTAAETHFQKAQAIDPNMAETHHNIGMILAKEDELDGAIAEYQKALVIDPGFVKARVNLGAALMQKGELDEAIAEYQKTLAIAPGLDTAHVNLGIALVHKGDLDAAIAEYQKALAISPGLAGAHNNLGIAFAKKGQLTEAIAQFQMILETDPANEGAQKNLAAIVAQKDEAQGRSSDNSKGP